MKIVLNIKELLEEGQIDQTEYDKLLLLSKRQTTSLAFNLLLGLGIVATSIGAIALAPSPYSCFIFGLIVSVIGLLVKIKASDQWMVLSITCLISGLLMSSVAIVWFEDYWFQATTYRSISFMVFILGFSAYFLKSNLLSALSILSLSTLLSVGVGYEFASYFIWVEYPLLTIIIFSILAICLYSLSKKVNVEDEKLLLTGSRMSVLLVNLGFWIGSLWGDIWLEPAYFFSITWALAIFGVGFWAWKANRVWLINVLGVFGSIHFYTQWFETLGAQPESLFLGGVIAVGIAILFKRFNNNLKLESRDN